MRLCGTEFICAGGIETLSAGPRTRSHAHKNPTAKAAARRPSPERLLPSMFVFLRGIGPVVVSVAVSPARWSPGLVLPGASRLRLKSFNRHAFRQFREVRQLRNVCGFTLRFVCLVLASERFEQLTGVGETDFTPVRGQEEHLALRSVPKEQWLKQERNAVFFFFSFLFVLFFSSRVKRLTEQMWGFPGSGTQTPPACCSSCLSTRPSLPQGARWLPKQHHRA